MSKSKKEMNNQGKQRQPQPSNVPRQPCKVTPATSLLANHSNLAKARLLMLNKYYCVGSIQNLTAQLLQLLHMVLETREQAARELIERLRCTDNSRGLTWIYVLTFLSESNTDKASESLSEILEKRVSSKANCEFYQYFGGLSLVLSNSIRDLDSTLEEAEKLLAFSRGSERVTPALYIFLLRFQVGLEEHRSVAREGSPDKLRQVLVNTGDFLYECRSFDKVTSTDSIYIYNYLKKYGDTVVGLSNPSARREETIYFKNLGRC